MIDLYFKCLNEKAIKPITAHETDAGFDLYAIDDILIYPGKQEKLSTGIAVQAKFVDPKDAEKFKIKFQVEGTSGNASKLGIFPVGGVVDQDYIGEIGVVIINGTNDPVQIKAGKKIAQLVPEVLPKINSVKYFGIDEQFEATSRGADGFGSTGIAN